MLKGILSSVLLLSASLLAEDFEPIGFRSDGFESSDFGSSGFETTGFESKGFGTELSSGKRTENEVVELAAAPQNNRRSGLALEYDFDAKAEASLSYFLSFPLGKRFSVGAEAGVHFRYDKYSYWSYDEKHYFGGVKVLPLVRFNVIKALFVEAGAFWMYDVGMRDENGHYSSDYEYVNVFGGSVGAGYCLFNHLELGVRYSFSFNEYDGGWYYSAGKLSRVGIRAAYLF